MVSITHFWNGVWNLFYKEGVRLRGTGLLDCIDSDISFTLQPVANAWDKINLYLRPNRQAYLRDYFLHSGEIIHFQGGVDWPIPDHLYPSDFLAIEYESVWDLYNTGRAWVSFNGVVTEEGAPEAILTQEQRDKYVWEIIGRACHLLGDMSVPAHTHNDIHATNTYVYKNIAIGVVELWLEDADSYEQWVAHAGDTQRGDLSNVNPWNASNYHTGPDIIPGLIQIPQGEDPLFFLMNEMRRRAAAFASDEFDADSRPPEFANWGLPIVTSDFPLLHNQDLLPPPEQVNVLTNIRDHTLPYCLQATATLLHWIVSQFNGREQGFEVHNVSIDQLPTYDRFAHRQNITDPFPEFDTSSPNYDPNDWRPSGTQFQVPVGDFQSMRSYIFPYSSTNSKFFTWSSQQHPATTFHQNNFIVKEGQSRFEDSYKQSITNTNASFNFLFEGQQVNDPKIMFKDPWLVNPSTSTDLQYDQPNDFLPVNGLYDFNRSTLYNGGIFLNQGPEQQPPYITPFYSLRASKLIDGVSKQHRTRFTWNNPLNSGDYVFVKWNILPFGSSEVIPDPVNYDFDYDTQALIFHASTTDVSADYKAHLHSTKSVSYTTSDCSTCPNSQRKLALEADGTQHLVYESNGHIYHILSYDRTGMHWTPETQLDNNSITSSSPGSSKAPCIAVTGSSIYVVWNENGLVKLRKHIGPNTPYYHWEQEKIIGPCRSDAFPVVEADESEDVFIVAFETISGLQLETWWQGGPEVSEMIPAISQVKYPSIARREIGSIYELVWLDNGSLWRFRIHAYEDPMPKNPSSFIYFKDPPTIPGIVPLIPQDPQTNAAPSITVDHSTFPCIAWTLENTNPQEIACVRKGTNGWVINAFSESSKKFWAPSIAAADNLSSPSDLRIAFNSTGTSGNGIFILKLNAGIWQPPVPSSNNVVDALHPNTTPYSITPTYQSNPPSDLRLVAPIYPSPIHTQLSQLVIDEGNLPKISSTSMRSSRELLLTKDSSSVSLRLGEMILQTDEKIVPINWQLRLDTLVIGKTTTVEEQFRTESFYVDNKLQIGYEVVDQRFGSVSFPSNILIHLQLIEDGTNQTLATFANIPLYSLAAGKRSNVLNHSLRHFEGKIAYVQMTLSNIDSSVSLQLINHHIVGDSSLGKRPSNDGVSWQVLSDDYQLSQNFPNPFNPSTEITFSIPVGDQVRLSVIDMLGREVAVLADGYKNAGVYNVKFNGENYPSGVYHYRLIAGKNLITKRMTLLR